MSDSATPANAATRQQAVNTLVQLSRVEDASLSAVIVAAQARHQPVDISQLRPTARARAALHEVVRDVADVWRQCEVIDYEPATTPVDGQLMWIRVADVPILWGLAHESNDLANLPLFEPSAQSLRKIRFAAMRVDGDGSSIVFVQALRADQVVARSKRVGVVVRRGVIDVPATGEWLLLGHDVAAIVVGDFAYFQNRSAFQRLFGYLDELREQAAATFSEVVANLRIDGLEEMRDAVTGSAPMLGKIASIQRKLDTYPQYKAALTMPKLKAFVEAHPECGVEITGDGDNARFVFRNDPQHRFKILKLLDDDYLRSELTTLEYDANSKSAPIGAVP